jgi:hypothetical protein
MDLETNPEEMEAIVEWKKLQNEKLNMGNIGSLDDQYME